MWLTWPNPVYVFARRSRIFSASCRGKQNVVSLWEPNYNSRLSRCPLNLGHLSELLCVHRLKVRIGVCVPFNVSFFFFNFSRSYDCYDSMIWNELTISRKEISPDYLTQHCISNWVCFIFISSCTFWLISAHPYFVSFHTLYHYLKSSNIMSIRAPRLPYIWLHPQKPVYSRHLKIRSKRHVFDHSNRSTCNFWVKLQVRSAEKLVW